MSPDLARSSTRSGGGDSESRRLVIVAPIYGGSGTGAATYYQILVERLRERGWDVVVISEETRGEEPAGLVPLFPRRSGAEKHRVRSAVAYAVQNLRYLQLPRLLARLRPDAVLVHSSFYNYPGWFPAVMGRVVRELPGTRFILDVRDQLLPERRAGRLSTYDGIIACAMNVRQHLEESGVAGESITLIPVPQEPLDSPAAADQGVRRQLGLEHVPFIFYAGLIKEDKRVDMLIDAFVEVVRPRHPELKLVLAGLQKADTRALKEKVNGPGVVHVGNLPRRMVLALMSGAELCVNPAPREGLPRSSLEALALGAPVLLPPNVPEFEEHCPEHVTRATRPRELGEEMLAMLRDGTVPDYPVAWHHPDAVLDRTERLLGGQDDDSAAEGAPP